MAISVWIFYFRNIAGRYLNRSQGMRPAFGRVLLFVKGYNE
jgi:hypothetical protein